ncbi:MAG: glycine cleavage system aminomethyltransferase GcvT [Planctomycetota bacterium]|nr:glycine cleavage system aminomethyltransferase GcvT [Planctomycetota bacterium]
MSTTTLQKTPFHKYHVEHGAKLVDYTGWEMPLLYTSILEEHRQVRERGGLFDVSHMGRFTFKGRDAARFLDRVCTRRIGSMQERQVRYSLVCNEQGGCRDDVLVYRHGESDFSMVCNAANRAKLIEHFAECKGDMVYRFADVTEKTAMVALQGPKVMDVLAGFSREIPTLKRYRFTEKSLFIAKFMVSRTGYTGEDGVEVILPSAMAGKAVEMILKNMNEGEITPCGLGARDSLRLEAGMALYGHEIDEDIDPLTAGLHFAVALDKGEKEGEEGGFIGQSALQEIAAGDGPARTLVGLRLNGRRAARQGMNVLDADSTVGAVTSGCLSPTLDASIAMAIVDRGASDVGRMLTVDLGRTTEEAEIVPLPFYTAS